MLGGFKNFLMQGELVVIAVGLVVALAFSTLIKAFTDSIITPLVNAIAGGGATGKGLGWTVNGQRINVGAFIGAVIYFIILMAVIYFLIVVPYRRTCASGARTSSASRPPPRPALSVGRTTCRSTRPSACTAPVS
jgi:large conductance mechanosensitive channel